MTKIRVERRGRGAAPAWLPWSIVALLLLVALGLFVARDALLERYGNVPAGEAGTRAADGDGDGAEAVPLPEPDPSASELFESVLGRTPDWPSGPAECAAVESDFDRALTALADRSGEDRAEVRALVEDAIARLASARPSPTAESGAPARLYANVVHVGRALGAERAARLAGLGNAAEEVAEPLAYALAMHVLSRDTCDPDGPLADTSLLYDYGVLLHGTVGGQGYVARRLPETAMLARFWSLVALGESMAAGRNPHGFDPQPALRVTRAAIARSSFALRDAYLAELDRIAALGRGAPGGSR